MRIVTAWLPSSVYNDDYPRKLRESLAKFGHDLEIVSETRWPGWWCKMAIFEPGRIAGPILYMDLDTVPVDSLSVFATAKTSLMLRDFYQPSRPASGVMFLTEDDRARVWRSWIAEPFAHIRRHKVRGDGEFIAKALRPKAFLQDVFPRQIASYKVDCLTEPPPDARLICYHGRPRPHVTNWSTRNASRWLGRNGAHFPPANALKARDQREK